MSTTNARESGVSRTARLVWTAAAGIAVAFVVLLQSPENGAAKPASKGMEAHDPASVCAECWLPFF